MKKTISLPPVLFLLFFIIAGTGEASAADSSQARFDRANQLYEEGNYAGALDIYREIEGQGEKNETGTYSHWKLFYNMGNCYYKLNRPVRAKIYYLRAQGLKPFENSIKKNIDIVNKRLNDKTPSPAPDFISRLFLRIESFITLNVLSVFLLILIIGLNVFVFLLIKKGKNRFLIYGVSFSLIIVLLLSGYHIYRVGKADSRNIAVITREDSQLRSGPGENNTVLFKVNPGLKVKIIDAGGNKKWLQVSASSQIAGWIEAENLEPI